LKAQVAAAALAGAVLAIPAQAAAATLAASPVKKCYRDDESITLKGSAFPAATGVDVARGGTTLNKTPIMTDALGAFSGTLTLAQTTGVQDKVYTASVDGNPAINATLTLRVSAVEVNVSPELAPPGTRLLVTARGFTNGDKLYAHIVRRQSGSRAKRKPRTLELGAVKGACGKLRTRARLVPRDLGEGVYRIQFDTKRTYSKRTAVKDVWHLSVVPQGAGAARASGLRR
jgi:hypothetical protein